MNVFIIGGDGFIGSHISRKFVTNGHQVTIFGPRLEENLLADMEQYIRRVEGDIADNSRLFQGLLQAKADVVIHLAAFGAGKEGLAKSAQHSPRKALDINIMGFNNVIEATKVLDIPRLLWSSSSTVFGSHTEYSGEVNERSAINPSTFYGATKVMQELMSKYYGKESKLEICGIRLPLVYGPGRWYKGAGASLVDIFEQSGSAQEVVVQGGEEQIDLMYVKDVADLFYLLATTTQHLSDIYHVKSHTTSVPQLVEIVRELVPEYKLRFLIKPSPTIYPLMNTDTIATELGYQPQYSVTEACQDYLQEVRRMLL